MTTETPGRFINPGTLTDDTPLLGSTARQWDAALKGNWAEAMRDLQRRLAVVEAGKAAGKKTTLPQDSGDLASNVAQVRLTARG